MDKAGKKVRDISYHSPKTGGMVVVHSEAASQATEEQYDYFLDCWSGDDEYQYLYDYYEKKYPEYNQELKHYGK